MRAFNCLVVAIIGLFSSNVLGLEVEYLSPLQIGNLRQDFASHPTLISQRTSGLHRKHYFDFHKLKKRFNYHVSIERGLDEAVCSGALIYPGDIVVTSASCDIRPTDYVRANSPYRTKRGVISGITCIKIHPSFSNERNISKTKNHVYDYDVALLFLNETFIGRGPSYVKVVKNPKLTFGIVTGFTQFSKNEFKNALIKSRVPVIDCNKYGFKVTKNMICAGNVHPDFSYCNEDRGNPLIKAKTLLGIRSWGENCARVLLPSVYTAIRGRNYLFIKRNQKNLQRPMVC